MTDSIPTNLQNLLGYSQPCQCGIVHSVDLKGVSLREGALADLPVFINEIGKNLKLALVVDEKTIDVAGEAARRLLQGDGYRVELVVVKGRAGERPHADEANLSFVTNTCKEVDLAVSVGSGTINDLTKLATFNCDIPYVAVATAPSMNGYTSAIAAIMKQGIKRTIGCHQPRAVIADLDILSRAPKELIVAGLGDLESKPTATADFRLASQVRGDYYCQVVEQVVFAAEERAANAAEGIGRADPEAIAVLTEALLLSGISMKLAGSSGPASGGEHLISHYWDMRADLEGREEGWHGAQVGVSTIVTAALYEYLRSLDPKVFDVDKILMEAPSTQQIKKELLERHGPWTEEVAREFESKRLDNAALEKELVWICNNWDNLWMHLNPVLRSAKQIRSILQAAGAPVTVRELGLSREHLRRAFIAAREIRGRFTVLDFAGDLGLLERSRDVVLQASGCLG
jgi:glycerol-1-phosphate dehydrogenase [NAD(P)+]